MPGRYLLLFFILINSFSFGQGGLVGVIYGEENNPLPFATIYVEELATGTTSNINGNYAINLDPGKYSIKFQYLGYASQTHSFVIGNDFQEVDIHLVPESLVLRNIEIHAKQEDPAYTIMRKAIAKSKFHTQQIDEYSARVYIKGAGRLVDSPFFLRKILAKEGIDSSFTFVTESISEISYKRPNTFTEKVIAIRTDGEDNNTSPNAYIMGSFYEPEIAEAVSPLSPRAFAYYRFEYLGTFMDGEYAISKIRVIPRSKGDDVFAGILNIVEDVWSIYSLNLSTTKLGISFNVRQIYNPIDEAAWLPVSHQFGITGTFFGFDFEYDYLATVSDYRITINPDLEKELIVIDEKVETALAEKLDSLPKRKDIPAQEALASGKEVTRKELRKLLKEYEKDEWDKVEEPLVMQNYSYSVDSTAAKPDSLFWVKARPVPLTEREVTGYHKMDSLAVVERQKEAGDTLKSGKRKGFHVQDMLLGNAYRFKNKDYLRYYSPLESLNFNTVEGYNFNVRFRYVKRWEKSRRLELQPVFRYAVSRKKLTGRGQIKFYYGENRLHRGTIELSGGKFTYQYNSLNPIHPLVNSLTTLLAKENYMKIYESGFVTLENKGKILDNLGYNAQLIWQERFNLQNTTNHTWIKQSKAYTSNDPVNLELSDTSFPYHRSFEARLGLEYSPWQKYRIRNDSKRAIASSSPTFLLSFRKAFSTNISETDYSNLEVGIKHNFRVGVRGRIGFEMTGGQFFNKKSLYFMDFKHFMGNETPLLLDNPVGGYRLLSYYTYSTSEKYLTGITYYQFRKFLLTQLPLLRLSGVKELVFLDFLATPLSDNYFEVGYGIDNLFRVLRVEGAVAFQDYKFASFGLRIGIATSINVEDNSLSFGF